MYANPLGVCSTQADTQTHWGDGAYCGVVLRLHSSCLILFLPFLPSTPATQSLPFLSGGVTAQSRGATLQGHTMARSTILPAGWEGSGNLWWGASCMRSETPELDGRVWRGQLSRVGVFFKCFFSLQFLSSPLLSQHQGFFSPGLCPADSQVMWYDLFPFAGVWLNFIIQLWFSSYLIFLLLQQRFLKM